MIRVRAILFAASTLLVAPPLAAQERPAWPERLFVTVDVPFQPMGNGFSESLSFADTLRRAENVTFDADYGAARGALVDVGAGVRVVKRVGVGITASWLQRSASGSFDLRVPNPLAANRPLELTGSVSGLNRREIGVHVQALYAVSLGRRGRVMLAAGPSVFSLKQDLVRSIEFITLPGFAALEFDNAEVAEAHRTAAGYNVGADVTWVLASHLGIGSVTRYTRATARFDPGSASGVSRAVEVHAGGLQIGAGIRLLF